MPTIAENLQTLIDIKAGLKSALDNQGKEPTDKFGTYAGLIDDLENPDDVEYLLTIDGTKMTYAQLYGQEKVNLTAGPNDIRKGSVAINNSGVVEGIKDIPGYVCRYGYKAISAGKEAVVPYENGYKSVIFTIAPFNSSMSASTSVKYVSVSESMYEVNSTTKISDISVDINTEQIETGITVDAMSILRYLIVREEV